MTRLRMNMFSCTAMSYAPMRSSRSCPSHSPGRSCAPSENANLVAVAACTAAGVLTHYFFCFTLLAGCVWIAF